MSCPVPDHIDPDTLALPPLREELRFMPAADDAGHAGGWLIFDPLRNAYFRITTLAARALSCWREGTVRGVLSRLEARHGIRATEEDLEQVVAFVVNNGLARGGAGSWAALHEAARRRHLSPAKKLLHGYLFFRIPLVRPQRFLKATLPYVRWLGTRAGIIPLVLISLLGLYLTGRQWDVFSATFMGFLSLEGVALFGLTLAAVKVVHELGHAYTAVNFGCRVPTMGVAFLVMYPMLYTDVTDAWRVRERRKRLLIGLGGILAELGLAGLALFLWAFLPPGPGRTAAFFVATTSLLATLLVNISPFMRFDGYHVLSDVLRMHNLAPRAFSMALWRLRGWLFGLKVPPPEALPRRMERVLVLYSFGAWLYRLVLFSGIALMVYHAFPKVIGIFLGAVELGWFIILPIWREVRRWWEMRMEIVQKGRPVRVLLVAGVLLAVLFAPLWGSVRLPAVMKARQELELYAPEAAQVQEVFLRAGEKVRAGQPLLVLRSRELEREEARTREQLRLVRLRLRRLAADRRDLSEHAILRRREAALERQLAGLAERRGRMVVRAEFDGVVSRVLNGLKPGMWVNEGVLLGRVVDARGRLVSALVAEDDVARLKGGAPGVFIPDDPAAPRMRLRLLQIGEARRRGRDLAYLASVHGGPVAAERDERGIHTRKGMFPVLFAPQDGEAPSCPHACRGRVVAEAQRESLAGRMARRFVSVVLRESGF